MLRKIITNPFFVFPALACLVFWPLTLELFTFKNDALTYYYPVRTLISDALNNGELPLWTPFINMGYPLHADMQSGAWNPVIWIFSFLTQYSLSAFHYEFLFYIAIAGIGFFNLCKNLGHGLVVSFAMALAYQFSGFMIDSVQFFNCISAAAYLPFIILFFRQTIIQRKLKYVIALSFFLFLMFTGGYPSLFIITCYTLVGYFVYFYIKEDKKKLFVKKTFPLLALSALLFIALSSPAIISFALHLDEIARGKGQSLAINLENSMNPTTMLSLVSPFGTTAANDFLNSSILMRSIYIGIIPLVFFVHSFFNPGLRQNKDLRFYLFMAIIMLMMAWGEFSFVRQIAYYILPLMDSFRHPALFRLFTIFFMLLIAAEGLQTWIDGRTNEDKVLKRIIVTLGIAAILIVISALLFEGITFQNFSTLPTKLTMFYGMNFTERFLLQLPFIILLLSATLFIIKTRKNKKYLLWIVIADLFFATQLNISVTVIGAKSFKEVINIMNRNAEKFPLPDKRSIEENIVELSKGEYVASPLPYEKKIGRTDVFITPGNLSRQDSFYYSSIRPTLFKHPVLFFNDSFITNNSDSAIITRISSNTIMAETFSKNERMLILQQNYYHGWNVWIDGKRSAIKTAYISLMSVVVPAGKHTIKFCYQPTLVVYCFYVSIATLILMAVLFIFLSFSKYKSVKLQQGN